MAVTVPSSERALSRRYEALPAAAAPRGRTVLLDKDGTLLDDVAYNVAPERMRFAPGAAEAVQRLAAARFRIAVVSNQSAVARGFCSEADVARAGLHLAKMLAALGVPLAGFYFCPHHPEGAVARYRRRCGCRKPQPGLLRRAALDLGLDLRRTWFVGDILDDVEAGRRAGCRTILIDNGNETEWVRGRYREPDYKAADLAAAARLITAAADNDNEEAAGEEVA